MISSGSPSKASSDAPTFFQEWMPQIICTAICLALVVACILLVACAWAPTFGSLAVILGMSPTLGSACFLATAITAICIAITIVVAVSIVRKSRPSEDNPIPSKNPQISEGKNPTPSLTSQESDPIRGSNPVSSENSQTPPESTSSKSSPIIPGNSQTPPEPTSSKSSSIPSENSLTLLESTSSKISPIIPENPQTLPEHQITSPKISSIIPENQQIPKKETPTPSSTSQGSDPVSSENPQISPVEESVSDSIIRESDPVSSENPQIPPESTSSKISSIIPGNSQISPVKESENDPIIRESDLVSSENSQIPEEKTPTPSSTSQESDSIKPKNSQTLLEHQITSSEISSIKPKNSQISKKKNPIPSSTSPISASQDPTRALVNTFQDQISAKESITKFTNKNIESQAQLRAFIDLENQQKKESEVSKKPEVPPAQVSKQSEVPPAQVPKKSEVSTVQVISGASAVVPNMQDLPKMEKSRLRNPRCVGKFSNLMPTKFLPVPHECVEEIVLNNLELCSRIGAMDSAEFKKLSDGKDCMQIVAFNSKADGRPIVSFHSQAELKELSEKNPLAIFKCLRTLSEEETNELFGESAPIKKVTLDGDFRCNVIDLTPLSSLRDIEVCETCAAETIKLNGNAQKVEFQAAAGSLNTIDFSQCGEGLSEIIFNSSWNLKAIKLPKNFKPRNSLRVTLAGDWENNAEGIEMVKDVFKGCTINSSAVANGFLLSASAVRVEGINVHFPCYVLENMAEKPNAEKPDKTGIQDLAELNEFPNVKELAVDARYLKAEDKCIKLNQFTYIESFKVNGTQGALVFGEVVRKVALNGACEVDLDLSDCKNLDVIDLISCREIKGIKFPPNRKMEIHLDGSWRPVDVKAIEKCVIDQGLEGLVSIGKSADAQRFFDETKTLKVLSAKSGKYFLTEGVDGNRISSKIFEEINEFKNLNHFIFGDNLIDELPKLQSEFLESVTIGASQAGRLDFSECGNMNKLILSGTQYEDLSAIIVPKATNGESFTVELENSFAMLNCAAGEKTSNLPAKEEKNLSEKEKIPSEEEKTRIEAEKTRIGAEKILACLAIDDNKHRKITLVVKCDWSAEHPAWKRMMEFQESHSNINIQFDWKSSQSLYGNEALNVTLDQFKAGPQFTARTSSDNEIDFTALHSLRAFPEVKALNINIANWTTEGADMALKLDAPENVVEARIEIARNAHFMEGGSVMFLEDNSVKNIIIDSANLNPKAFDFHNCSALETITFAHFGCHQKLILPDEGNFILTTPGCISTAAEMTEVSLRISNISVISKASNVGKTSESIANISIKNTRTIALEISSTLYVALCNGQVELNNKFNYVIEEKCNRYFARVLPTDSDELAAAMEELLNTNTEIINRVIIGGINTKRNADLQPLKPLGRYSVGGYLFNGQYFAHGKVTKISKSSTTNSLVSHLDCAGFFDETTIQLVGIDCNGNYLIRGFKNQIVTSISDLTQLNQYKKITTISIGRGMKIMDLSGIEKNITINTYDSIDKIIFSSSTQIIKMENGPNVRFLDASQCKALSGFTLNHYHSDVKFVLPKHILDLDGTGLTLKPPCSGPFDVIACIRALGCSNDGEGESTLTSLEAQRFRGAWSIFLSGTEICRLYGWIDRLNRCKSIRDIDFPFRTWDIGLRNLIHIEKLNVVDGEEENSSQKFILKGCNNLKSINFYSRQFEENVNGTMQECYIQPSHAYGFFAEGSKVKVVIEGKEDTYIMPEVGVKVPRTEANAQFTFKNNESPILKKGMKLKRLGQPSGEVELGSDTPVEWKNFSDAQFSATFIGVKYFKT
ncbi:MAG: hypothetical protein LBI69_00920 [Puniceicoccales bacterium]|jgi:hypothetical protein|nr:hypothetical protein [Puniceicoccales bacterium]